MAGKKEVAQRRYYTECKACGYYSLISGKKWQQCTECGEILPIEDVYDFSEPVPVKVYLHQKKIVNSNKQQQSLF